MIPGNKNAPVGSGGDTNHEGTTKTTRIEALNAHEPKAISPMYDSDYTAKADESKDREVAQATMLDASLEYAARGWPVFPIYETDGESCACGDPGCSDQGKHPRNPNGLNGATTDSGAICYWWKHWPEANIGVATGPAGLLVLDVDDGGEASLESQPTLPDAPETVTGSGGRHILFERPTGAKFKSLSRFKPGLDSRADGGYIVAPPSTHKSGQRYEWRDGYGLPDKTPPQAPGWLIAAVEGKAPDNGMPDWMSIILEGDTGIGFPDDTEAYAEPEIDKIKSAIAAVDPDDRGVWVKVGMAVHSELGDDGFEIWDEWARGSEKHDAADAHKTWDGFDGGGDTTIATLYHLASEAGWREPRPAVPDTPDKADTSSGVDEIPDAVQWMNERHAFIHHWGSKPAILSWRDDHDMGRSTAVAQSKADITARRDVYRVTVGEKTMGLGSYWIAHPNRREYQSIAFAPEEDTPGVLNLWQGFGVESKAGGWPMIREHIRDRIASGDDECDAYIIKWLAWAFQNPGGRAEVALVMRGGRGTGKGMLARAVMKVFGQHSVQLSNPSQVSGGFNAQHEDCALMFADEAVAPNNAKAREDLKRMITEPTLNIERKGIDAYPARNRLKILMASNNDWVIPAGDDERRFAAFDVAPKRGDDEAYFTELVKEIEGDGPAAMLHDLRAMDLNGWHPRYGIPQTKSLGAQKAESLDVVDRVFLEMLESGEVPVKTLNAQRFVTTSELLEHVRQQSPRNHVTLNAVAKRLGAIGAEKFTAGRPRGYHLPSITEARRAWDANKFPHEWDDAGNDEWVVDPSF